jgi:arginine/lysine/ornithine decarboxylase
MPATQPLQMTTPASPTLACSPACSSEDTAAVQAGQEGADEHPPLKQEHHVEVAPVAALTPRQAFFADREAVALQDAVGRVSAELLCPYPPGLPVVFPGECFTAANVQQLQEMLAGGGVVTGGQDSMLRTVLVVTESGW